MSNNCSLDSRIPKHLWTPQLRSLLSMGENCILYSFEGDEFYVPSSIPATSSSISSILDAALDDKHILESLSRTKMVAHELALQRYAMSEKTENGLGEASSSKSSPYRGVTKVNDERFEAFVWDNTISEAKTVYIGGYWTEIEAARAHDLVSIKLYGVDTLTNVPVMCYGKEIYEMQKMSKKDFITEMREKGKGFYGLDTSYRGVYRVSDGRIWEAWLSHKDIGSPKIFLGIHYTIEDAARAHDVALIKFKGMDAITNFDLSSYEVKAIIASNTRPTTMKKVPTHTDIVLNKVCSEALSSSSNSFFLSQPLNLQLKNSSISTFHGKFGNNQNPCSFKLSGTGSSGAGTSKNAINGDNIFAMLFPSQYSQETQAQKKIFRSGRPQTMKHVPTMYQHLLKKRSYSESSSSSSSSFINKQQPLTKQMRNSSNSFFIFQSNPPRSSGGLIGTTSQATTNDKSIGNFGAMFSNQGANVEQPLTQHNSSFSLHGSQNLNFMQRNSSSFGGFIGTTSQAATKDNPIGNYGEMFANQGGNVKQSMLLGTGQDFQATQDQQNQLNVNINNEFKHDIFNNNQYLPKSPSLSLNGCSLPDLPSDFEVQLSPLLGTGLQDFDAPQEHNQLDVEINNELDDHDLLLNNQPFPQSPSLTLVHHDTQNLGFQNDITSNFPKENSSKPSFFSSFLNLCSETNTTSLSQVLEHLDDSLLCPIPNSSNDSFQNPCSETNAASQDGLDSGQNVSNLDGVFQNPISETNTSSQILMTGSQNDLDISDYLSDSYAVEEETDWIGNFCTHIGKE